MRDQRSTLVQRALRPLRARKAHARPARIHTAKAKLIRSSRSLRRVVKRTRVQQRTGVANEVHPE